MKCSEIRERALQEDWEDKGKSQPPEFEKHLKECEACLKFVEETRKAALALSRTEKISVPADLWDGLRLKLQNEAPLSQKDRSPVLDRTLHYLRFINPKWAMGIAAGFILIISLTGLPFKMHRVPSSYENVSVLLLDTEDEEYTEDFGSDIENCFL